jgi:RES domain
VLYLGDGLATSACEVFGEAGEALICPSWRVALLEPVTRLRLLDLVPPGSAMAIGALPTLGDGALRRSLTQEWARAVYEDHPLGAPAAGIRYRSAYNGGIALALWDTTGRIQILVDDNGTDADVPLNHPGMLIRLKTLLIQRQIVIRTIPREDCPRCTA